MNEITKRTIDAYKNHLIEEEKCSVTIEKYIRDITAFVNWTEGNELTTTGGMEIYEYTRLSGYEDRIYSRVMSNSELISACEDVGIKGRHLIGMYGPFSKEMNCAMIRDFNIKYVVTKDYGISTGFVEKMEAALDTDTTLIVVASSYNENSEDENETVKQIRDEMEA